MRWRRSVDWRASPLTRIIVALVLFVVRHAETIKFDNAPTTTPTSSTSTKPSSTPEIKAIRGRRQNCGPAGMCGPFCCPPLAAAPLLPPPPPPPSSTCVCTQDQQDPCCISQYQPQSPPPTQPQASPPVTCICTPLTQQQSPLPAFTDPCCLQQIQHAPQPPPPVLQPKVNYLCTPVQQDPCCTQTSPPTQPPLPPPSPLTPVYAPTPTDPCDCLQVTLRIHPPCNCAPQNQAPSLVQYQTPSLVQNQAPSLVQYQTPSLVQNQPPPPQSVCVCTPVQQDQCCFTQLVQEAPPPPSLSQPQLLTGRLSSRLAGDRMAQQDPCCSQPPQYQSPLSAPSPNPSCICTPVQQDSCCNIQHAQPLPPQRATCICAPVQQDSCCQSPSQPQFQPPPLPLLPSLPPLTAATCICTPVQQDPCCLPHESPSQDNPLPQTSLPMGIQSITIQCVPLCGPGATNNILQPDASLRLNEAPSLSILREKLLGRSLSQQRDMPLGVPFDASSGAPLMMPCAPLACQCQPGYNQCAAGKCCLRFARHPRNNVNEAGKKAAAKILRR